VVIDPTHFDAVLFDLDGVLTDTARIHAHCWKRTFDDFLRQRAERTGAPFRPFEIASDYRLHVDGKPRFDGVRDFLRARGISLPEGRPDSPPEEPSICGLGNRKNALVEAAIREQGVDVYPGSIAWVRHLRGQGIRTGVVSSSANCQAVLHAAGIEDLFDVRVDGGVARQLSLRGKPHPETFLEAARRLAMPPERVAVVEDALSGVQAGRAGNFGLVIGVARKDDAEELAREGADLVVHDLGELLP
jgi:beta-phosphoglucomutase family hydrolase